MHAPIKAEIVYIDMENIQIYEVLIRDYGTSPRFKQFLEKNYIDAQNGMDYIIS